MTDFRSVYSQEYDPKADGPEDQPHCETCGMACQSDPCTTCGERHCGDPRCDE